MSDIGDLVSVIVPVYNVEDYITDCVSSITMQTYKNLEIILVNDGSTDTSGEILEKLKIKDSRIILVDQKNGGVSKARNTGLDKASGDYIMFIDSDDWIDQEMVEKMLTIATTSKVGIVSCGMKYVDMSGKTRDNFYGNHTEGKVLNTRELYLEIIDELTYGGGSLCCRLIERGATKDVRFIESMRISEDQEWLLRVAENVSAAVYLREALYNVRVRRGSATTKSRLSDIDDIEVVNRKILSWASNNNASTDLRVVNTLFVRARLQYSSAIRADSGKDQLSILRKSMISRYARTVGIHKAEKIKYYISLLPPGLYLPVRSWLKQIRNEVG